MTVGKINLQEAIRKVEHLLANTSHTETLKQIFEEFETCEMHRLGELIDELKRQRKEKEK